MKYIKEYEAKAQFEDEMRELFPTVTIMGYEMDQIDILKDCDPVAYYQEFYAWLDSNDLTTDESEVDEDEDES